jgi:hypothetical protein
LGISVVNESWPLRKGKKVCEACADDVPEQGEVSEGSEPRENMTASEVAADDLPVRSGNNLVTPENVTTVAENQSISVSIGGDDGNWNIDDVGENGVQTSAFMGRQRHHLSHRPRPVLPVRRRHRVSRELSGAQLEPGRARRLDGGFSLQKGKVFEWRVATHGSFGSVDEMAGPSGFHDPFAVEAEPIGPNTEDGQYTLSSSRYFTTAP